MQSMATVGRKVALHVRVNLLRLQESARCRRTALNSAARNQFALRLLTQYWQLDRKGGLMRNTCIQVYIHTIERPTLPPSMRAFS